MIDNDSYEIILLSRAEKEYKEVYKTLTSFVSSNPIGRFLPYVILLAKRSIRLNLYLCFSAFHCFKLEIK